MHPDLTTDPRPATLANWRTAPFSRWAFRHVDALLPTAPIANDPERVMALPAAPLALDGFRLRTRGGETLSLDAFLRRTQTDGFLVIVDGRIACEWLADGMGPHTRHILMSATKSVIGLLCGILVERGRLDIDAPAATYVPEIAHSGYAGARLRDLLDMRAEPRFDEDDLRRYAAATHWDPVPADAAASGLHDFFSRLAPRETTHNGAFRYLSANTDLLGWVLERAAGQPLAELAGTLLWSPLGAEQPAAVTLDRCGAPRATGGLCATLRDFGRVGQLMVDGGRRDSASVVPAAWIDDIAEGGDADAWARGEFAQAFGGLAMRYRSGWYVIDDEPRTLFAMGIHGQHLFVDRANRLVIAKLSSQPQALDAQAIGHTLAAVREVRRCVIDR